MNQNVEVKARVESLDEIRGRVLPHITENLGIQQQTDSYFQVPRGRLKTRQIDGQTTQLIWYQRPDESAVRISDYRLMDVPGELVDFLAAACGLRAQVVKSREVLMFHNVRVHLDAVEGLGKFIELEGVIDATNDEKISRERLDFLCEIMCLDASQYLAISYGDMALSGDSPLE